MADMAARRVGRLDDSPAMRPLKAGRHDPMQRRQAKRSGRERGCWAYIPAEVLQAAGHDPDGPPPFYRVWGDHRGSVLVRLYRQP